MKKWKLSSSEVVFETPWMSIEKRAYRLPDGTIKEDYYHLNRPDYVLIVAVNDKQQILVEKQYRRGVDDFVYELPAGWIEKNESPATAEKRELKEETGLVADGENVYELYAQPGFSSMMAYAVVLYVETTEKMSLGNDEAITTEWMTLSEIEKKIADKEIKDMGFLSALNIYKNLML